MTTSPPESGTALGGRGAEDRLESWKEIAAYLNRTVRTAQLWEQQHGMPVHRPSHGRRGIVYAYRSELEAWFGGGRGLLDATRGSTAQPGGKPWAALASLGLLVAGALGWWLAASQRPAAPSDPPRILPFTTDGGYKGHPALSPDGERVAYEWRGDIYVKAVASGSEPHRLTEDEAYEINPAWSPDGREIAFVRWLETGRSLHTVPALGGQARKLIDLRPLLTGSRVTSRLAWSPDGTCLAFAERPSEHQPPRIVRLSLTTLEVQPLTSPPDLSAGDLAPAFSPDGIHVAFVRAGPNRYGDSDVWIQHVDDGDARRLTSQSWGFIEGAVWMPDGRSVLVTAGRGERRGLWRVSLDGGAPEPIPGVGRGGGSPSVQGGRMVFQQLTTRSNDVWRVPGRRRRSPRLRPEKLIASSTNDVNAAYSPNGRRIAFASMRDGGIANIWVSDSDGGRPAQVTRVNAGTWAGTPRWSPDGRRIVFDSNQAGDMNLYVVDADGGSPRRVTHRPSSDVMGTWSRDGRWIYFRSDRSGDRQVWRIPADGGEAVQVTTGGGEYGVEAWDGRHVYYTRVGRFGFDHGIWRVPVDGGEEEEVLRVRGPAAGGLAASEDGLYHLHRLLTPEAGRLSGYAIHFLHFESGEVSKVFEEKGGFTAVGFLAVSPDEEWLLVTKRPLPEAEVMLVENFR